MKQKKTLFHGPRRLLAAAGMLGLAVALVAVAVLGYPALRRDRLTAHSVEVPVADTRPLTVGEETLAQYGVESVARTLDGAGQFTGYRVVAARQGYKSLIRVACTFTADGGTLAQLAVLSQDETEYLGERVQSAGFTDGFTGRLLPVKLRDTYTFGSPVDGLTGSTVSAQAVVEAVNNAYGLVQEMINDEL